MAKQNRTILFVGLGLLAVAAGTGIYYWIRSRKKDPSRDGEAADFDALLLQATGTTTVTPTTSTQVEYSALPLGSFPIGKGQTSKLAWIMQSYMNCRFKAGLVVDGKAGSKTEQAFSKYLGNSRINSVIHLKFLLNQRGIMPGACESIMQSRYEQATAASNKYIQK